MSSFLVPAICVIGVFWISCIVMYWMIRKQLAPIVRSIKRLEHMQGGRTTEDFTVPFPKPRPIAPSRYVTVDRGWK